MTAWGRQRGSLPVDVASRDFASFRTVSILDRNICTFFLFLSPLRDRKDGLSLVIVLGRVGLRKRFSLQDKESCFLGNDLVVKTDFLY